MPGTDTSAYDAALKTVYEGGIRELIPTKVKTLTMFEEKDAKPWGGRYVEYPFKVGRNQGSGWATEMGNLPSAGRQQYVDCRIPMRYQYGRIQLSGQVIKASEGPKAAFASAMDQEMRGIVNDMANDRGRAIMHDGRGVLCLVNGASSSTTVTVDSPGGVSGSTNGARFVNPTMIIGFINPNTGALRSSSVRTIQTVAANGNSFTIDSSLSVTDNDYIVRAQTTAITAVADTGYQKEMMGLLGLIDDGTYVNTLHGINRTSYPIAQSSVISTVGAWSADAVQRIIDLADERGGGDITDLIMHHSVRRAYITSMEADRRYTGGDLARPDGGTVAAKKGKLAFGAIPITEEKYAPYGIVFAADRSGFSRYVLASGEWMDEDGSILQRVGTGSSAQDAFEGTYRIWDNMQNDAPNSSGRLDGVQATVVVAHID